MATPPSPHNTDAQTSPRATSKQIHSLILDTGPLVKNDPPADVLRSTAEQLYILPSIIPEIRDAATRSRVETTLLPFVITRSPKPESVKFIQAFARKTGDLDVLSRPDIQVLALGYELECERNGGDWRLRNTPGQKGLNGRPNQEKTETPSATASAPGEVDETQQEQQQKSGGGEESVDRDATEEQSLDAGMSQLHLAAADSAENKLTEIETNKAEARTVADDVAPAVDMTSTTVADGEKADETAAAEANADNSSEDEDEDGEGWITPSNLKKHQARDADTSTPAKPLQKTLQAAILTSDYAMQNVALRMNLNLVAPSMARITRLKTWVLRCHGCFKMTRDTARQFCPSCGQATLLRTSCSTDDRGNVTVHLKRNFQWNNRGNVYSVPKPVHGSASGKGGAVAGAAGGGGKDGWGRDLILAEDQKEYVRATEERRRAKNRDLMDEDVLPGILSGQRAGQGGKIRVGAGRNVNSRRKHK